MAQVVKSPEEHQEHLSQQGLYLTTDNLVRWKGSSPDHPRNWSRKRKVYDAGLIILLDFWALVMRTPSLPACSRALGGISTITEHTVQQ